MKYKYKNIQMTPRIESRNERNEYDHEVEMVVERYESYHIDHAWNAQIVMQVWYCSWHSFESILLERQNIKI